MFGFGKHIWIVSTLLKMSQHNRYHHDWSFCYVFLLAAYALKWSQLTPWKYTPTTPTDSAPAIRYVHNFCLAKLMPVSLNIFICIHVSISKGMEVNPPPQGEGMSQCFLLQLQ